MAAWLVHVGIFDVQKWMGINWRMVEIGKKVVLTFCKMFANVTQQSKESIWIFKTQNIRWYGLKIMLPKNLSTKKIKFFRFCTFLKGFLTLKFYLNIFKTHQRIWNQYKILRFFHNHNFLRNIVGHIHIFANTQRNRAFSRIYSTFLLLISILLRLIPTKIPQKVYNWSRPFLCRTYCFLD